MNSLIGAPLRRIIFEAIVLSFFATVVGLSLNYQLLYNVFTGKSVATTVIQPEVDTALPDNENLPLLPFPVEFEELESLLADGAVLVDARSLESYQDEHLKTAVSLPFPPTEAILDKFKQQVGLERTLITYCSGYGCHDSFDLGIILLQAGYAEVLVYEGGVPQWRDAGLPLVGGEQ